jgi:trans-2-enoyl-CoA reductase
MTDRNGLTEPPAEPRALLGLLYGVIEEAERYEGCLQGTDRIHDRELADFLSELRDETRSRADRAETLPAQRLANGGVQ